LAEMYPDIRDNNYSVHFPFFLIIYYTYRPEIRCANSCIGTGHLVQFRASWRHSLRGDERGKIRIFHGKL